MQTEVVKRTIFIFICGSFSVWCVCGSNEGRFGKVKIPLISSFFFVLRTRFNLILKLQANYQHIQNKMMLKYQLRQKEAMNDRWTLKKDQTTMVVHVRVAKCVFQCRNAQQCIMKSLKHVTMAIDQCIVGELSLSRPSAVRRVHWNGAPCVVKHW